MAESWRELFEVLEHWASTRESRLDEVERAENLRCAVDLVEFLRERGVEVPVQMWKHGED